jgi:hypothetical protein
MNLLKIYTEFKKFNKPNRIIAIGDIHGDLEVLLHLLKNAGVIDIITYYDLSSLLPEEKKHLLDKLNIFQILLENNTIYILKKKLNIESLNNLDNDKYFEIKWKADINYKTSIIQVGDQIDRCRNTPCYLRTATFEDEASDFTIICLFDYLHTLAEKYHDEVISLLGNHEIMNLQNGLDYVSFANQLLMDDYFNEGINNDIILRILSKRDTIYRHNNKFLFGHAGITSKFITYLHNTSYNDLSYKINNYDSKEKINLNNITSEDIHKIIDKTNSFVKQWVKLETRNTHIDANEEFNKYILAIITGKDTYMYDVSPIWTRIYNTTTYENDVCASINSLLNKLKYKKLIVGHVPQYQGIAGVCKEELPYYTYNEVLNPENDVLKNKILDKKFTKLSIQVYKYLLFNGKLYKDKYFDESKVLLIDVAASKAFHQKADNGSWVEYGQAGQDDLKKMSDERIPQCLEIIDYGYKETYNIIRLKIEDGKIADSFN